jgi:hypothetical protein
MNNSIKVIICLLSVSLFYLSFNSCIAASIVPLKIYLKDKDIDDPENQVFLLQRCSAIFTFISAVLLEKDVINSKKYIDIGNKLLFKSTELLVIDFNYKFENAEKLSALRRSEFFEIYVEDGKKNWVGNNSYFKGSYIAEDMLVCSNLIKDQ